MQKKWIKIIGIFCLLLITIAVGTYFLYLLPKQNDEKLAFEKMKWEEQQKTIKENEENKQKAIYRKECVAEKEQNIKDYEDFINACTGIGGNSIDFCVYSTGGKLLAKTKGIFENEDFITTCIDGKINLLN